MRVLLPVCARCRAIHDVLDRSRVPTPTARCRNPSGVQGVRDVEGEGFDLIAADSPTSFLDDTPTARLIRQVLGAISEFEKAMLVEKLKGARDRKRRTGIKVEGRKSIAEQKPEAVQLARKLARARPKGGKRSLREISAALAEAGHTTGSGTPYAPTAIKLMLAR